MNKEFVMEIVNLNILKKYLGRSIIISLAVMFIFVFTAFFILNKKYHDETSKLQQQKLQAAVELFKSNLSAQLSIVASSEVFLNYLRSGPVSREDLYPLFLSQILSIKTKDVSGMEIDSINGSRIFSYGAHSNYSVPLKVCYLNGRLDKNLGECSYLWTIFLSIDSVINTLQQINQEISACQSCNGINLLNGNNFGDFLLAKTPSLFIQVAINEKYRHTFVFYLIFVLLMLSIFAIWNRYRIKQIVNKFLAEPLQELTDNLKKNLTLESKSHYIWEIKYLLEQVNYWRKQEHDAEIGRMSAQVAHDIRSPLASLSAVMKQNTKMPEPQRLIIRNAANRINDIANNLLNKYRNLKNDTKDKQHEQIEPELIISIIDSLLSEKRAQFSDYKITFDLTTQEEAQGIFAAINSSKFQRVISNLLNNSVEAIKNCDGRIDVQLSKIDNTLRVEIIDNGCGIEDSVLSKINKGIYTSSKETGTGIGISSALENIKSWHGNLYIKSKLNEGSQVTIDLPIAEPPAWFLSKLQITKNTAIVVIDDDISIHNIWTEHFKNFAATINLTHFYTPDEILKYNSSDTNTNKLFLIDYEFIDSDTTGINIIKQLNIFSQSILVTSRYEDEIVRNFCIETNIKIIPKNFVPYIKIETLNCNVNQNTNAHQPDLIFIDDDINLTDAWKSLGVFRNKKVATFNNRQSFIETMAVFSKNMPIYIDSYLHEVRGEYFAKELFDLHGFKNIYLATGRSEEEFDNMYWIKKVVGKEPPF